MSTLTVMICAEGRGKWCLKARPNDTASCRDSIDRLEQLGAVDAQTARTARAVLDALDAK